MENIVTQVMAWGISLVLGITAVWKVVEKFSPKIRKALKVADEALDVINAILDASSDKKITADELRVIAIQLAELQEVLS